MSTLVRDVLSPAWQSHIRLHLADVSEHDAASAILNMTADCHCGIEVRKIVALCDFVMLQWPDADDEVLSAALHQINVVCFG